MTFYQLTTICEKEFRAVYFFKLASQGFGTQLEDWQQLIARKDAERVEEPLYGLNVTNLFTAQIEDKCFEDLKEVAQEIVELEKDPNTLAGVCF